MSFWQENYAFIKDVYDTRASKLTELMDKTENAIKEVVADKIYTSEEFKKVKETFAVSLKDHVSGSVQATADRCTCSNFFVGNKEVLFCLLLK